ncbi:MAG: Uma2 family endonuclease [Phototrophicaceae bacterium]
MLEAITQISPAAFDEWAILPENRDKRLELIHGEVFELPSNAFSSEIAAQISFLIKWFLKENKIKGHVTGEAAGFRVGNDRYAPDVAYLSATRQAELDRVGYNRTAPELVVEVISSDSPQELHALRVKISNYLALDCVVWIVNPVIKQVEVHIPNQAVIVYNENDTIHGEPALPGLSILVSQIFDVYNL